MPNMMSPALAAPTPPRNPPSAAPSKPASDFDFSWEGNLRRRFYGELVLVRLYWWKVLLALFCLCYLCIVVFRNLAFMRHRPMSYYAKDGAAGLEHDRLRDLGFDVTPDWSDSGLAKTLNEVIQNLLNFSLVVTAVLPAVYVGAKARPHFFHVGLRYLFAITTCHMIRPLFYMGTSLPGPASHCIGAEELENRPTEARQIFAEAVPGKNCGDLVFSGHMLMVTTVWMLQVRYVAEIFDSRRATRAVHVLGGLLIAVQAYIVICTRNHYTVDVVAGITLGLFNWMWHQHVLRPNDPDPEDPAVRAAASAATPFLAPLPEEPVPGRAVGKGGDGEEDDGGALSALEEGKGVPEGGPLAVGLHASPGSRRQQAVSGEARPAAA